MKIIAIVAQILLGLMFFVFGLNGFIHFIHAPLPSGLAGEFFDALFRSHYVLFISGVELIAGALLLINRFVPLALALLAPVLANILVYHATMDRTGAQLGILATMLWIFLAYWLRAYFAPMLVAKTGCGTGRNDAASN